MNRGMRNVREHWLLVLAAGLCLCNGNASESFAAGFWLYESGQPDLGLAAAGRAAAAKDASTAGSNPAGMTRLDRSQALAGVEGIFGTAEFDTDSGTTVTGGNGGNAASPTPLLGSAYVHSLSDRWRLGVTLGSAFGGALNYNKQWAGRYYGQDVSLTTLTLNPAAAYRINELLSVGAGLTVMYSKLKEHTAINNVLESLPDGRLKYNDDAVALGGFAGVMLELAPGSRIGATYRSKIDLDFRDRVSFSGLGPGLEAALDSRGLIDAPLGLTMTVPQGVMVSGYHELNDRLALLANVGWQDWSQFGNVDVGITTDTTTNLSVDLDLDDTYHLALGLQVRLAEPWLWSVGTAYDSSPMDVSSRSPVLPMDRQIRYGTGIQYDWSEKTTLGMAYEFLDLGENNINVSRGPLAGTLQGDFDKNYVNFVNLTVIRRF